MSEDIRRKQKTVGKRYRVYTYLSKPDHDKMQQAVKKAGISKSYFLAEAIRQKTDALLK